MILFEALDIKREIIFGIIYFVLFMMMNSYLITYLFPKMDKGDFRLLQLGSIIRLLAAVAFGFIHLTMYTNPVSDTGNYHLFSEYWLRFIREHDAWFAVQQLFSSDSSLFISYLNSHNVSLVLRDSFCSHPQLLVVQLGALINLFSSDSYVAKAIVFASIGFVGILFILKTMHMLFPSVNKRWFVFTLLFIPSVAFWTSGYMKEPLCILSIGIIFYSYICLVLGGKARVRLLGCLLIFGVLLGFVKLFLLMALCVSLGIFTLLYQIHRTPFTRQNIIRLSSLYIVGIVLAFVSLHSSYLGDYSLGKVIGKAHTKFTLIRNTDVKAGSSYESCLHGTDAQSVLISIPKALNTAMFRPYLWEANNLLSLLSAVESAAVLCGTLFAIFLLLSRMKLIYPEERPIMLFLLILPLGFFYFAAISSSNFGTLVRYKSVFMPFYLMALSVVLSRGLKSKTLQ